MVNPESLSSSKGELIREIADQISSGRVSFGLALQQMLEEVASRYPRLSCTSVDEIIQFLSVQVKKGEPRRDPINCLRGMLEDDGVRKASSSKIANNSFRKALAALASGKPPECIKADQDRCGELGTIPYVKQNLLVQQYSR